MGAHCSRPCTRSPHGRYSTSSPQPRGRCGCGSDVQVLSLSGLELQMKPNIPRLPTIHVWPIPPSRTLFSTHPISLAFRRRHVDLRGHQDSCRSEERGHQEHRAGDACIPMLAGYGGFSFHIDSFARVMCLACSDVIATWASYFGTCMLI